MSLEGIYLVPGLPQLLQAGNFPVYRPLHDAMSQVAEELKNKKVERIVYFSTQWISVLANSFQAGKKLQGVHTDENWHDLEDLPFKFNIDATLATHLAEQVKALGMPTQLIDFEGFPVDTATIVADRLLNHNKIATTMISCNVYADLAATKSIGEVVGRVAAKESARTAVVCVSGLSSNYFTTPIHLAEDHVRHQSDDDWNRNILKAWTNEQLGAVDAMIPDYAAQARVDMGFKAFSMMLGVREGAKRQGGAKLLGYGPLYGTAGAVVAW